MAVLITEIKHLLPVHMPQITTCLSLVMYFSMAVAFVARRKLALKLEFISRTLPFLYLGSICTTQAVNPDAVPSDNTAFTNVILGGLLAITWLLVNCVAMASAADTNEDNGHGAADQDQDQGGAENQDQGGAVANPGVVPDEEEQELDMSPDMSKPVAHVQWMA